MDSNCGKDLIWRASEMSASSENISDDLVAALFPKSHVLMTDRMISYSHQHLRAIILSIETEICLIAARHFGVSHEAVMTIGNGERCHSYPVLGSAGLLESKALIEHVFVRSQLAELNVRLQQKVSQEDIENSLTRYLDHEDNAVSEASMALLVAQSRSSAKTTGISEMPAELLYSTTWSVVAAIEKLSGYAGKGLTGAAEKLLADHDEGACMSSRAVRLAQLIDLKVEGQQRRLHPLEDGLYLFLAILAQRSTLHFDEIVKFTAEPNMIRLVVLMRALDISPDNALSIFAALDGGSGILTVASYKEIETDAALELVQKWSMDPAYRGAKHAVSIDEMGRSER